MKLITTLSLLLAAFAMAKTTHGEEVKVGDQAPAFKLEGSDGKTYQLSDFKDKQAVVLAWFPKAFTGG